MNYYINRSCIDKIAKIAISFYEEYEIIEAKKKLRELYQTHLGNFQDRKNSDKRTGAEAHLADIIEALTKLDLVLDKDDEIPVFVAKNIERLPDRQPEELNLLSIVNRLSSVEKNLKAQENILTEHRMELISINTLMNLVIIRPVL